MAEQENLEVIRFLNRQVSNFAVLYVKLHRYHWFIQGELFYTLHAKFEEMYEEMSAFLDDTAERVLAIGGRPLATMAMYLKEASLREAEADDEPSEMLNVLLDNFNQLCKEMKEGRALAEKHGDAVTADFLTSLQAKLEKHQWMLRSILTSKTFKATMEPVLTP